MRIGTRGSALALAQARLVADRLEGAEIEVVRTSGDRGVEQGDKSRWVAELEQALLAGVVDLAVHSAKDVPGEPTDGLELLGAPRREAPEDVLIGAHSLDELPEGAYVGTSSARRAAQLLAARSDLEIVSLRGNVDTRLRKLAEQVAACGQSSSGEARPDGERGAPLFGGESSLHAIVLASAGLRRLGREQDIGCTLAPDRFVPAPGQGALALQARADDQRVREALAPILDKDASACLLAERALARALGANCNTPLGAHATAPGCGCLYMHAWIGLPDGSEWIADELMGGFYDPQELGTRMAERLQAMGARDLLQRAEAMAVAHP
jgi:hydroxymethylbilane synthase